MAHEPLAYTLAAFCEAAGFKKSKLYNEAAAGRLTVSKCGGKSLILADEARRFLSALPALSPARATAPGTRHG